MRNHNEKDKINLRTDMHKVRGRKLSWLIFVLGFIPGLLYGSWLHRTVINRTRSTRCSLMAYEQERRRPKSITEEIGRTSLVFVGLLTDLDTIHKQVHMLYDDSATFIRGTIVFFVTRTTNRTILNNSNITVVQLGVQLDTEQEIKYLFMLRYITQHYLSESKWFMLVENVFLNTGKLTFLRNLSNLEDFVLIPESSKVNDVTQHYLSRPGIIMSSTFLRKISPHLLRCFQQFSHRPHGDQIYNCLNKGFTIEWYRESKNNSNTTTREHSRDICHNIDQFTTNIITADLSRDTRCVYRLQEQLLTQKLRINGRNYVRQTDKLKMLKRLIASNVYERRTQAKTNMRRNNKLPAQMFKMNKIFSLGTKLSWTIRGRMKRGIVKVIGNVMDKLREAHSSHWKDIKFRSLHYGYSWINPVREIRYTLDIFTDNVERHLVKSRQVFGRLESRIVGSLTKTETVNIVVPLAGRLQIFKQFMENLEINILSKKELVTLLVVYFSKRDSPKEHLKIFHFYKTKYPGTVFNWLNVPGDFARAHALQTGVDFHKNNSLMFLSDVDLNFNSEFLQRCRSHSVPRQLVYFPVMFRYFNPEVGNFSHNSSKYFKSFQRNIGDWSLYSFGPVCAHRDDIKNVGGFNMEIKQWGFEDVQLFERFLSNKKYEVMRTPDPGLLHVYHPHVHCDVITNVVQRSMCTGAMLNGLASQEMLIKHLLQKRHLTL